MLKVYLKLLDRAVMTVNSTGKFDPDYILARLKRFRARGYTREYIEQIIQAQREQPPSKPIPLSPELRHAFKVLGKALRG